MNGLESPLKVKPDVELIAEINKEYTLKQRMVKQRGLILFAVFPDDDYRCERVTIKSDVILNAFDKSTMAKHEAAYNPNAIYTYAINEARAKDKVKRELHSFILRQEELAKNPFKLPPIEPVEVSFFKLAK